MTRALRFELVKIATLRSSWITVFVATLATPLVALVIFETGGFGPHATVSSGAAAGTLVALLIQGSWAATLAAGEDSQSTLMVSAVLVPGRLRLYSAKLLATAAVAAASSTVAAVLSFVAVLGSVPAHGPGIGNPFGLVGVVAASVCVTATGVVVGSLLRSTTLSVGVVVAVLLLPRAADGLLGGLQPWVVGASPGTVVSELAGSGQVGRESLFPWGATAAAVTMVAVATLASIVGAVVFRRRDV